MLTRSVKLTICLLSPTTRFFFVSLSELIATHPLFKAIHLKMKRICSADHQNQKPISAIERGWNLEFFFPIRPLDLLLCFFTPFLSKHLFGFKIVLFLRLKYIQLIKPLWHLRDRGILFDRKSLSVNRVTLVEYVDDCSAAAHNYTTQSPKWVTISLNGHYFQKSASKWLFRYSAN